MVTPGEDFLKGYRRRKKAEEEDVELSPAQQWLSERRRIEGAGVSPPPSGEPLAPSPAPAGEVPTQDRPDSEIMEWIQQQSFRPAAQVVPGRTEADIAALDPNVGPFPEERPTGERLMKQLFPKPVSRRIGAYVAEQVPIPGQAALGGALLAAPGLSKVIGTLDAIQQAEVIPKLLASMAFDPHAGEASVGGAGERIAGLLEAQEKKPFVDRLFEEGIFDPGLFLGFGARKALPGAFEGLGRIPRIGGPGVLVREAPSPAIAALPPGVRPLPGDVPAGVGPGRLGAMPEFEPALVVVDAAHPRGERLVFGSRAAMEDASLELGLREGTLKVLPGDAPQPSIRRAASELGLAERPAPGTFWYPKGSPFREGQVRPGVEVTLGGTTRRGVGELPSQRQRTAPIPSEEGGVQSVLGDITSRETDLMDKRRELEGILARTTETAGEARRKGTAADSVRQSIQDLENNLRTLEENYNALQAGDEIGLAVKGIIRREPVSVGRQRVGTQGPTVGIPKTISPGRWVGEGDIPGVYQPADVQVVQRGIFPGGEVPVSRMLLPGQRGAAQMARAGEETVNFKITVNADDVGSPEHIAHLRGKGGDIPPSSGDIPESMGGAPPDLPPEVLAQQVSFPQGKPRLSDPADFAEEIGVSTVRNRAARLARGLTTPREGPVIGENLARTALNIAEGAIRNPVVRGILRWTPALRNPSLFAEGPVQQAGLVRAALIDDGRQKITGLTAHARQFGNQDDLFGRTLRDTGLLDQGRFKGFSVNEIAENPSKFNLNPKERRWIDEMDALEKDLLDFRKRNGETVDEIRLGDDVQRYAGRVHLARVLDDGTIIERASIGPQRLATTEAKHRTFKTMAEARKEGYVPLSYEQSFVARAQSAYNRAVNRRTEKWVMDNLPPDIELRPRKDGEGLQFGETIDAQLPSFRGKVVSGTGDVNQFIEDVTDMFPSRRKPGPIVTFAKGVNQFNLLQRMFSLAGDASIVTIQFKMLMDRHPIIFGRAVGEFTRSLVGSMLNPAANRVRRAKKLADNAELIQDSPGLIMPDPAGQGIEFMESLGHGGFLGPEGLYGGQNKILKAAGRAPGTGAGILRPFQQALEAAMEDAGINLMKSQMHKVQGDPTRLRGVIDYVNNMRGLSSSARLGLTPNQRLAESMILLAPRYRRAIASLHADVIQGGLRGGMARQAYASLFAGTAATYTAFSYALGAAQGKSEQQIREQVIRGLNPANREFLLWKVGGSALGVGSKMVSDMRILARAASDPGELGDFTDFNRNTGVRWVRSQLAAAPADGWDWLMGADYLGEPITRDIFGQPKETLKSLGKTLGEDVTFLWLQAAAFEGGTRADRILKGGADFFGARAYPYPGPTYDDVANEMYGKDFDELAPPGSKFHSAAQRKVVEAWGLIINDEKKKEIEEARQKRKTQSDVYSKDIRLDPNWQRKVSQLGERYR